MLSFFAFFEGSLHLALVVSQGYRFAFIVLLFAPGEPQLYLRYSFFKVQFQGHQREPFSLHLAAEVYYLPLVQQQLARPGRLVVVSVAARIRGDMGVQQPELTVSGTGVGVFKVDPAATDGLYLGAGEDQPRLHALQDMVVVIRLAVDGDYFLVHSLL
jgi:hypothetical protein